VHRSRCHTLPPLFLAGGIIETFGGLLLLLGLFPRPVAFILSGDMSVAYFKFHAPPGFWPLLNDGEGAVLYCFIFPYLASTGGGPWSFDRWLRKRASTLARQVESPGRLLPCVFRKQMWHLSVKADLLGENIEGAVDILRGPDGA